MTHKNIIPFIGLAILMAVLGYFIYANASVGRVAETPRLDATPKSVILSGAYECLPHADTTGPQTMECAFGLKTDSGDYYAVNFGASADAMAQFQSGAYITAEGFVVIKEALSSDHWAKYNMKGIFTITNMIDPAPTQGNAKIDINVVCASALSYMTFPNGDAADQFLIECKAGKHPEVIERHKAQTGLGAGAEI